MSDMDLWLEDKQANGWEMPAASWWRRLPVIRHMRAAYHRVRLERHNAFYLSVGMIPSGYDNWVIYGIAKGMERKP